MLIGLAAVGVFLDVDPAVVYVLAVAATIATTPFRSAQAALTPSLARTPRELTAANAVASTVESLAAFVGPALAGLLLAVASTGTVFLSRRASSAVSAFFVLRIRAPEPQRRRETRGSTIASEALVGLPHGRTRAVAACPRRALHRPDVRRRRGQVYIVVLAIELLDLGDAGVGYLNSALGIGALIGGVLALSLTGARRLSPAFLLGRRPLGRSADRARHLAATASRSSCSQSSGVGNSLVDVAGVHARPARRPGRRPRARVRRHPDALARRGGDRCRARASCSSAGSGLDGALIVTGALLPALVRSFWREGRRASTLRAAPPEPDELQDPGARFRSSRRSRE